MPFIVAKVAVLIVADVHGPVVLVSVKKSGPKGVDPGDKREGTPKVIVFDGSPSLPVPVTLTLGNPLVMKLDEPLTVKLTSVNVESGPAVSVLPEMVKSLGIGSKALVPGVSGTA